MAWLQQFDYNSLTSNYNGGESQWGEPNQLSQGMEYMLVNGGLVIDQGKMTRALPGKVLRGFGYRP